MASIMNHSMRGQTAWKVLTRTVSKQVMPVWKVAQKKGYHTAIPLSLGLTALKVVMHSKAYQQEGFSKDDQRLLFTQEMVRQVVSTGFWLMSLCFAYEAIVEKRFPKRNPMEKVLIANVLSQIPDTFVRPFLTAKLSKTLLQPQPTAAPLAKPSPLPIPTGVVKSTAKPISMEVKPYASQPFRSWQTYGVSYPLYY